MLSVNSARDKFILFSFFMQILAVSSVYLLFLVIIMNSITQNSKLLLSLSVKPLGIPYNRICLNFKDHLSADFIEVFIKG